MKFILLWSKWSELKLDLSLLGHVHLSLCQKHKLRVANEVKNLRYGPDPTLGIVYFDSWQSQEWRVAIMSNAVGSGVGNERERTKIKWLKNQLTEKWNKKYTINTNRKRRESLALMKKQGKIARWKNMRNMAK